MVDALIAAIDLGTIYLFATLGEIITQRSGIMNLGVEGMIMFGAIMSFIVVQATSSLLLAVLAGMIAAGLLAAVHAALSIKFKVSQVVSGLALTIAGVGLAKFLGAGYINQNAIKHFPVIKIPVIGENVVGRIIFEHSILVYLGYLLVPALSFFLFKTKQGMRLRAVGENPAAADAAGINVFGIRYFYTILGGMLAGLSGAYLALSYTRTWQLDPSNGAGWIAVALVIFALWRPSLALVGSLLFGFVSAMQSRLQTWGIDISVYFMQMLPYLATVAILIFISGRVKRFSSGPASLGVPYDREER